MMNIIVKCWTPDFYDFAEHAVIEFDLALVDSLLAKIALAERITGFIVQAEFTQAESEGFMGLEYDSYDPRFVTIGDPETIGMTEDEFDELSDGGFHIFPREMDNHDWNEESMRPVMLMVMAARGDKSGGRVYWYGYDKHGGADCRSETYSFDVKDLQAIRGQLKERSST